MALPPNLLTTITTTLGFYILMTVGFFSNLLFPRAAIKEWNRNGYPQLFDNYLTFYIRYVMRRFNAYNNFIVTNVPGAEIVIKERKSYDGWTLKFTGTTRKCLNLGSYNYLNFARNDDVSTKAARDVIEKYSFTTASSRRNFGTCPLHRELEKVMAEYLGVEDVLTFGMGFATNVETLSTLVCKGCLVLSDSKSHASAILGLRFSGATVRKFKHNDVGDLEDRLKEAILLGQNNKSEPWKKILIVVEGIYSMDGTIVQLPKIIALKKRYKAYLYMDEAHSIGAIGKNGRGIVEYFGCNPRDVDILMGTYTKSYAAAGGYIGGKREVISMLRKNSLAWKYATAMSPPVTAHIIYVLNLLMGRDGTNLGIQRLDALARNTKYFRRRLEQVGIVIFGHHDSPIVPFLTHSHSKTFAVVKKLMERKIASVGVNYPFVPLKESRIRICLQAGHTKDQLDYALKQIAEIADELGIKYARNSGPHMYIEY